MVHKKLSKQEAPLKKILRESSKLHDLLMVQPCQCFLRKIGERITDPPAMYSSDILTASANLAGICASSQPVGEIKGLSVWITNSCK